MEETKVFIRRESMKEPPYWRLARKHTAIAYEQFINLVNMMPSNSRENFSSNIVTSHLDGGFFVATFNYIDENNIYYVDEQNNRVEIRKDEPNKFAYVNRLTT
jgi:hypothetical protein